MEHRFHILWFFYQIFTLHQSFYATEYRTGQTTGCHCDLFRCDIFCNADFIVETLRLGLCGDVVRGDMLINAHSTKQNSSYELKTNYPKRSSTVFCPRPITISSLFPW